MRPSSAAPTSTSLPPGRTIASLPADTHAREARRTTRPRARASGVLLTGWVVAGEGFDAGVSVVEAGEGSVAVIEMAPAGAVAAAVVGAGVDSLRMVLPVAEPFVAVVVSTGSATPAATPAMTNTTRAAPAAAPNLALRPASQAVPTTRPEITPGEHGFQRPGCTGSTGSISASPPTTRRRLPPLPLPSPPRTFVGVKRVSADVCAPVWGKEVRQCGADLVGCGSFLRSGLVMASAASRSLVLRAGRLLREVVGCQLCADSLNWATRLVCGQAGVS